MAAQVDLDFIESASASHHISNGWAVTRVAVVTGLNPAATDTTGGLFQEALAALIAVVGDRGSACPDISVPTYLEEFIPELLGADCCKIRIVYRGYPLPTTEFDGVFSQVETNIDAAGNPITVSYTYPSDYSLDPRKAGKTFPQGALVPTDVNEPVFTIKFMVVPGLLSFFTAAIPLPAGVTVDPYRTMSATEWISLLSWYYTGKVNNASYLIGVILGQARQWKITKVSGVSKDGGRSYEASMSFQLRVPNWDTQATFINPDDGKPPADLVANTGYYSPQILQAVTFPTFPVQTN